MTPPAQLTLTARLNTSAVDSRRGVIRLHPNAIAALGIREWDAVSITGARTTTAVAGMAGPQTPIGTVLLDDVTLSNAGLSEDTAVIVVAATVYGARSVTLSGSTLATQSVPSTTLRQALLGKVLTVGDAVSLLPRDLGPGTSTSAATRALASAVGISWTSELLTVTGVDPSGPVSVQPNSLVTLGQRGVRRVPRRASGAVDRQGVSAHRQRPEGCQRAGGQVDRVAQARARRTAPVANPGRHNQFGRTDVGPCWCRQERRWSGRCAPAGDWWNSTAPKSARWPPKTACSGWSRRRRKCATAAECC